MKNLKYSLLDLVTLVGKDSYTETFQKSVLAIQKAEEYGFERYWFSEHHNMPSVISSATSVIIAHAAEATKTIRVGAGGIMLPNHSTLSVAENFGTLDALFPGRIDLGLGRAPGTDPLTAAALRRGDMNHAYNFEYHIRELQRFMSLENKGAQVRAFPGEGADVPLYILGSSTDSAFLAAKMGLPYVFAGHFAPTQFTAAFEIYQTRFTPGEALKEPYTVLCVNIFAADTEEEAVHHSLSHFQAIVNLITDKRQPLAPPEEAQLSALHPQVETRLQNMTALTLIGDREILKEKIKRLVVDFNLNEIMAYTNMYDFEAKIKSLKITSEVFKELRGED